ncbi:MAG TPA: metalloregulator ArsR/SmtB family transcription factor [Gammaproteobacteria bacterium]|nr:metalloregulator ArsR/SmtB family transcription factor [Gammaproteobacteria bacterium]
MLPEQLTKALADSTRMRIIYLLSQAGELCVCNLTETLQQDQPKISRHLAVLRKAGLVMDRRDGQWIHYRIHPDLPHWAFEVIQYLAQGAMSKPVYQTDLRRLDASLPARSSPQCD